MIRNWIRTASRRRVNAQARLNRIRKRERFLEQLESRQLLAQDVAGLIDSDTTWSGTIRVTSDVTVASGTELTISPGTVVKFDAGRFLDVDGELSAIGTSASPIVFTTVQDDSVGEDLTDGVDGQPIAGLWEAIYLNNGDGGVDLQHVLARYGGDVDGNGVGGGQVGTLVLGKDNTTLSDVRVQDAFGTGLVVNGAPSLTRIDVQRAGIAVQQALDADASYRELSASDNRTNGVVLSAGILSEDRHWDFGGLPALLSGNVIIGETVDEQPVTLSVAPGTVVKFGTGTYLQAREGTLTATGTAAQPIVFTALTDDSVGGDANADADATVPYPGFWESLYLDGPGNRLEHLEVRFAGDTDGNGLGGGQVPAIRINHEAATTGDETRLQDVRVSSQYSTGVSVLSGSPRLTRVHVEDGLGVPFFFQLDTAPQTLGLTARDNAAGDRISIQGGRLQEDRAWNYGSLPISLTTFLEVASDQDGNPVTLSIAPGTVIKMPSGHYLQSSSGTIAAVGTPAEPIVITAASDDSIGGDSNGDGESSVPFPGSWESVYLDGPANALENVEIRYAGDTDGNGVGGGQVAAIRMSHDQGSAETRNRLTNVRIADSYSSGAEVRAGSPDIANVHVESGLGVPFVIELDSDPTASGLTATGNAAGDQILIRAGILRTDRTWDFGSLPVHLTGLLEVADEAGTPAILSIAAGSVVKVPAGAYLYSSTGSIQANGTAAAPITFTATSDDSVGGDSNGDGTATTPYRGFWESIYLEGPADVLEHVDVRYAGDTDGNGVGGGQVASISIDSPGAQLSNVRIRDGYSTGVGVASGAPQLHSINVSDGNGVPFFFDLTASPTVSDLSAQENLAGDHILLEGGTLREDRRWNYGELPIHLTTNLIVASDGDGNPITLEIAPGTVVKVPDAAFVQSTTGKLLANGTASEPIVFTSTRDDTAGGDSNGSDIAAFPGVWESIYLEGPGSELSHVSVRYAGDTDGNGVGGGQVPSIVVSTDATLSDLAVESAYGGGLSVRNGATVTLNDARFDSVTQSPTQVSAVSVSAGTLNADRIELISNAVGLRINSGQSATVNHSFFVGNTVAVSHLGNDPDAANLRFNWWDSAAGPHDPSNADGAVNDNPAGQGVTDFVDYSNFLTTPPNRVVGPRVVAVDRLAPIPAPLHHRYEAETSAADESGTRHGLRVGDPAYGPGRLSGSAFLLDGDGDYVDLGAWAPANDWTVAAWVNPDAIPNHDVGLVGSRSLARDWMIGISGGNYVAFYKNAEVLDSGIAATVGVWSHVAATLQGSELRIYTDGVVRATVDIGADYVPSPAGTRLGHFAFNNAGFFPGRIDEVSILERGVSDAEVITLQDSGSVLPVSAKDQTLVVFDRPIDVNSLDLGDFSLTGPGIVSLESIELIGDRTLLLTWDGSLTVGGDYTLRVGPNILGSAATAMDQNSNGIAGEDPADVFVLGFDIDARGPMIVSQTPSGTVANVLTGIEITFDEPIDADSLTPDSIRLLDPAMVAARDAYDPAALVPGFHVRAASSRVVFSNIDQANNIVGDPVSQIDSRTDNGPTINFAGGGQFAGDRPVPFVSHDYFVVEATGTISIPPPRPVDLRDR